jgi:hypothetical protein
MAGTHVPCRTQNAARTGRNQFAMRAVIEHSQESRCFAKKAAGAAIGTIEALVLFDLDSTNDSWQHGITQLVSVLVVPFITHELRSRSVLQRTNYALQRIQRGAMRAFACQQV